jgi:hypothetical protein
MNAYKGNIIKDPYTLYVVEKTAVLSQLPLLHYDWKHKGILDLVLKI